MYAWMPGGRSAHLFGIDGYNVARALEADGGFDLLTREAVFYLDPRSREVLRKWENPFTDEAVEVVHIWNDPVNQRWRLDGPRGPWRVPCKQLGEDVLFTLEVPLAYPSPLQRAQFPESSQDDLYTAVEMFGFTTTRRALDDDEPSAPSQVSWTRIAPWLPFMRMADRPGQLVYHAAGAKLRGGYAELPEWMRAEVEGHDAAFTTAPRAFTEPNETSWTYFRKLAAR
ncbi:MAG: DUF1838 domain-containing protein [Actinobacteria bacterium]|nr:DUF1838 domain-containing protein [Actinomycetota bacterium]